MSYKQIESKAMDLVNITIEQHNQNKLGKETMKDFFENNLGINSSNKNYYDILCLYPGYLAQAGYEIKIGTQYFDVIDYTSDEYEYYCYEKSKKLPNNYNELQAISKRLAKKLIHVYRFDKDFKNKDLNDYCSTLLSTLNNNKKEKNIILAGIPTYLARQCYSILETKPLTLRKFC